MKWLKNLCRRMFSWPYIRVRNRRLRNAISMLDELIDDQTASSVATDLLVRTFTSEVLVKYKDVYNIPDDVLRMRAYVCSVSVNMLFNNISVYQPYLQSGNFDVLNKEYVNVAYTLLPNLLLELMQYGPTPEIHSKMLSNLTEHMDTVRRRRRDLFMKNPTP